MLTRYRGKLALQDWALDIGRRSTMRKARIALARRLAIIMHAMLRHGTEFKATPGRALVMAPILSHAADPSRRLRFQPSHPAPR